MPAMIVWLTCAGGAALHRAAGGDVCGQLIPQPALRALAADGAVGAAVGGKHLLCDARVGAARHVRAEKAWVGAEREQ